VQFVGAYGPIEIGRGGCPREAWGYQDVARHLASLGVGSQVADRFDVLEAGGGSASHVPLPAGARVTTIDISPEQLARNTYAAETLLGDLQTFDFGMRRFDLVVVWDVLEHLEQPEAALERLAAVVRSGGRLVVVGPLPSSFKGLVTRLTPHRLHVLFYRHVLGSTTAGEPGHAPFPTTHATGADPQRILDVLARRGLTVDALTVFESIHVTALAHRSRVAHFFYRCAEYVLSAVTFGRVIRGATDFCLVATSRSA
jgi:SAM-dependent methyltransferase